MIYVIIAPVYTVTEIIFDSMFTRNNMLRIIWIFHSSNEHWNCVGYPLGNHIFNILFGHILIFWVLLRLINFIYWFVIVICHLMIIYYE
ncbi:hypothetical protein Hanom_Chr07g00581201 [Helianthus anomalus]